MTHIRKWGKFAYLILCVVDIVIHMAVDSRRRPRGKEVYF